MVKVYLSPPPSPYRPLRPRRALRAVRWSFLIIAVACLGYSGYAYLESGLSQAYENWILNREIENAKRRLPAPPAQGYSGDARRTDRAHLDTGALIGRIEIPRLRLSAIVREGVDDGTLRHAVGHVPETARPGDAGNVGLAAHRDTFFRPLKRVRKDDRIIVETVSGRYEYLVDSTQIVHPDDVQVLRPTREPVLTLVTCYPFYFVGNAPKRFVVRAHRVVSEARNSSTASDSGS